MSTMLMSARARGWREKAAPGVYRAHLLACPRTADRRPGGRCPCPWRVVVPGAAPGTTRTVTVEGTATDAKAAKRRLSAERPAPVTTTAGTLDALAAQVFRARAPAWAANTLRNRDDDYRTRIAPGLGTLPLPDVNRPRVEEWLAGLVAVAPSRRMVVQTVATLHVILGAAVEWGLMPENPARRLRLPRADDDRAAAKRVIGRADLDLLFASAGSARTESMLRMAGEAGLRRGEIAGLRWEE